MPDGQDYLCGIATDITEHKLAEEAALELRGDLERHVEERTRELQDAQKQLTEALADAHRAARLVKLGTYEWDNTEDRLVACSEEYARMHELSVDETLATCTSPEADYSFVHPDDREGIAAIEAEALATGEGYSAAYRMLLPSGRIWHVREVCEVKLNDQGEVIRLFGSLQDVSEQVELEEQLRHAQKMEAVGQLAGGIAHDFNNLLTVINGYSDSCLTSLRPEDPLHHDLNEIKAAGDRAAALIGQLLAFSRKQLLEPKVIDLGEIIVGMDNMLRRLIGDDIQLDVRCDSDLNKIKADPGQIEQVVMNRLVNARDALPQGGTITMSIENVVLDDQAVAALGDLPVGDYVMLTVSDTGVGMEGEALSRIFEPFYTTKAAEKGTGLGLATVFGIVKQSGGGIEVESASGKGSTFRIYLPQVEASEPVAEEKERGTSAAEGRETIMIVDDEEMIRELLERTLEGFGYTVLTAQHGAEALQIVEQHEGPIDLMVTDVVMPQMSGHELAKRLAPIRPKMSVLYISGYDEIMVTDKGLVDQKGQFLQKPFIPKEVVKKIRTILDKSVTTH